MFCPKCRTEYVSGVLKCHDCGMDLVAELPPVAEKSPARSGNEVTLAKARNGFEADIVLSCLRDAGVEGYLRQGAYLVERWAYVPPEERTKEYIVNEPEISRELDIIIDEEDRDKAIEALMEIRKAFGLEEQSSE